MRWKDPKQMELFAQVDIVEDMDHGGIFIPEDVRLALLNFRPERLNCSCSTTREEA